MWRIMGCLFHADKNYFCDNTRKAFRKECLVSFLTQQGIAIYDAATEVKRLQDNASDKFLEVIEATDISLLLKQLPHCKAVVTTGQKATELFCEQMLIKEPAVGQKQPFFMNDREMHLYRMPSSSRAYPLSIEKKSEVYHLMLSDLGFLSK